MNLISALYDLEEDALHQLLISATSSVQRGLSTETSMTSTSLDVSPGKFNETPLMVATVLRSTRVVRMVMGLVPEHINGSDVNMTTALALAARTGNADKVRLILEAAAPSLVYYADRDGVLPIMHAIRKGHVHLMRLLVPAMVQHGQPHLETGCTRLGEVLVDVIRGGVDPRGSNTKKVSVMLVEEIKRVGPLALSKVLRGSLQSLINTCLVASEYEVLAGIAGAQGLECALPTMVVRFACGCGKGCYEEVDRILRGLAACAVPTGGLLRMPGGAEPGKALLTAACQREYPSSKVIRKLLDMGALQIGPEAASVALLELLRSFNRSPTSMLRTAEFANQGCTWTSSNFLNCMDHLLDAGADVTTVDRHGLTAVHYAALSMNVEVIVFLLSGCLVKVRAMHHAVLYNPERAGTLPVRTRMAGYGVDIDGVLQLLKTSTELLPWTYDPHCDCAGCFQLKLEGVLWALTEWQRGSPPDMALHLSMMFGNRMPDGTLQFRACPLSHLHGTMTGSASGDDSHVSASEVTEESAGMDEMDEVDEMDEMDEGRGRGLEEPSHWYTSFV